MIKLVHGLVTAMLDMGSILLFGLPQKLVSKLQRVQNAPDYLKDLLSHYNPSRVLRSKSCNNLEVPRARGAYGTRAFSICGPRLWNKLPSPLKNATTLETFKKHLKTHLFQNVYN